MVKSLILLRYVGETQQFCSDHGKWVSLNTVTLLMTPALTPASFIKGQSWEGAGFNLGLIVIIAPDYLTLQHQVLYRCFPYISSNCYIPCKAGISTSPIRGMKKLRWEDVVMQLF